MIVLGVIGALLFLAAQLPNMVKRKVRYVGTVASVAIGGLAILLSDTFDGRMGVGFAYLLASLVIGQKWVSEIHEDMERREEKGRPSLIRHLPGQTVWDVSYCFRYRRQLFKDPWSRHQLLRRSWKLPLWWVDEYVKPPKSERQ